MLPQPSLTFHHSPSHSALNPSFHLYPAQSLSPPPPHGPSPLHLHPVPSLFLPPTLLPSSLSQPSPLPSPSSLSKHPTSSTPFRSSFHLLLPSLIPALIKYSRASAQNLLTPSSR
ncbi:hypothetical protein Pcinc_026801 [Petrolisthes cinctipes]|uniref:Uncharacterized protein n=1 Tax=Petrolisthes cinctipes TaxID=88211 RepID=A0AAE1K7M0_PETCI|nr:hypothetical protein Pcinc_026801 [Petrolisthes cinctipes]